MVTRKILTLSNVSVNKIEIDLKITINLIKTLYPEGSNTKFFGVKEFHSSKETHYHFYIVNNKGIRKNTYKKLYRNLFPEFSGMQLDIKGVKNENGIIKYFFKGRRLELIQFCTALKNNIGLDSEFFIFRDAAFITELIKKDKYFNEFFIIIDIMDYTSFSEGHRNINNLILYAKKGRHFIHLGNLSRNYVPCRKYVSSGIENIERGEKIYDINVCLDYAKTYNISGAHLTCLNCILYDMLIREGKYPFLTKQKNIAIIGEPNTGKTSLITKLIEVTSPDVFYFIGSRANDFSNYKKTEKSILIGDDVFSIRKQENVACGRAVYKTNLQGWFHRRLLKIFAHEEINVDVKYGVPFVLPRSSNIIISNHYHLFHDPSLNNLKSRIKYISLNYTSSASNSLQRFSPCHGHKMRDKEFIEICYIVLDDLRFTLKEKNRIQEIVYRDKVTFTEEDQNFFEKNQ